MKYYRRGELVKQRLGRSIKWIGLALVVVLIVGVVFARRLYTENLKAVNPTAKTEVIVAIPTGSSLDGIAKILHSDHVIRSEWAFKRYVTDKDLTQKLQAGTYRFNTSQNVSAVVAYLVDGKVDVELFTIFPAQRLDQIRQEFIDKGFSAGAVDSALKSSNYSGQAALVDKPAGANLEGYLYPDSYQRTAEIGPDIIVASSLAEMAKILTPELRSSLAAEGLSVYKAITLASIVEQEIPSAPLAPKEDRRKAAQVFLKRLKIDMQLGSDVTAKYGAINAGRKDLLTSSAYLTFDSPYNTRLHGGLPPGPIGNVTADGLDAVAHPADTDYLYFVAGDDHVTYFSKTLEEHQALTAQHCKQLCN